MKKCDDYSENVEKSRMPGVVAGDTVRAWAGDIAPDGYYDYLVVRVPCRRPVELRLVNLQTGCFWDGDSLWGSLGPHEVQKVNLCYKEVAPE